MEVAPAIDSSQRISHRVKTRTLKTEGCGTHTIYPLRTVADDILPPCHVSKTFTVTVLVATRLKTGTSSSTNGTSSEFTVAGAEQNLVVPIEGVPIQTPATVGTEISIESGGFWKAVGDLFLRAKSGQSGGSQTANPKPN